MNTKDIAVMIADLYGMSYRQADRILHTVFGAIKDSVADGDTVRLAGLGSFSKARRSERVVHPPIGGKKVIPAHGVVKFSASKFFKDAVK